MKRFTKAAATATLIAGLALAVVSPAKAGIGVIPRASGLAKVSAGSAYEEGRLNSRTLSRGASSISVSLQNSLTLLLILN